MLVFNKVGFYVICWLTLVLGWAGPKANGQDFLLKANHQQGGASRVKLTLAVNGKLRQVLQTAAKQDGSKPEMLPQPSELRLKVSGQLMYDELLGPLTSDSGYASKSARYYHHAEAAIEVGGQSGRISLGNDRRFIVSHATDQPILYAVDGPLTREELDLIVVPGNSLLADQLLPNRSVRIGDDWSNKVDTIAGMLNWTKLTSGKIVSRLEDVKSGLALITIKGSVQGVVDGAESEASIRGEFRYDLNWHRVTWLSLKVRETQQGGPIHPGFDVAAELRMRIEPLDSSRHITADILQTAWSPHPSAQSFLTLEPQAAAFTLTHDRRWQVTRDMPRRTILQCVDDGELLAQLNVSQIARLPDGKELSLDAFQADVREALGDRFREFVSARKSTTQAGYRVLRIDAAGTVGEVPIRWIYYHISDSSGRRAAHVYTFEAERLDRFGTTDEEIVSGFRFRNQPVADPSSADSSAARKPGRGRSASQSR